MFSQSGERFVFYMYFMPRLWLLIRNPNWSFHKFSVWLVKSIRIPICDALIQKSHCFQITMGFITLSAVINVLGYMLLVVIFVLLWNGRHIGFVALPICRHIGFRHFGFRCWIIDTMEIFQFQSSYYCAFSSISLNYPRICVPFVF